MKITLPFLALAAVTVLVCGCMSSSSGGQPPNYVESQLTQDPLPRGSMFETEALPGQVGGPE
jgi:hypothetical protein